MADFRLVHLSDLHIKARRERILGISTDGRAWEWLCDHVYKGENVTPPKTFSPQVASCVAEYIYNIQDDLDAVLITGDIANTGSQQDLSAARDLLEGSPYGKWGSQVSGFAPILGDGIPVCMLPGNHDRFGKILRGPSSKDFEKVFGTNWSAGQPYQKKGRFSRRVKRFVLPKDGEHLVICCVDFSLRKTLDAPSYLSHGRAYKDCTEALKKETVYARKKYRNATVIWAMHFPPGRDYIPRILRLMCGRRVISHAKELNVDLIFSGHTHCQLHYPTTENEFPRIITAGTATSRDYNEAGENRFLDIKLSTDNGRVSEIRIDHMVRDIHSDDFFARGASVQIQNALR